MNESEFGNRERIIAALLLYGTWLASIIIAAGLAIELAQQIAPLSLPVRHELDLVKVGVALFILLPIARVAVLAALFLHGRDYIFSAMSALILMIIGAGFLAGR